MDSTSGARPRCWRLRPSALGALVLRIIGLHYGLPAVYNPDEVAIMARALASRRARSTRTTSSIRRSTSTSCLPGSASIWRFVDLTGRVASLAELQKLYFTNPTGIYTAGRASARVRVPRHPALYRLGARLRDQPRASPRRSSWRLHRFMCAIRITSSTTFPRRMPVVVAYLAIVRIWPAARAASRSARDTASRGAACGVAFSTHYYCVFLALPADWAVVQAWRRRAGWLSSATGVAAAVASAIVFFCAVAVHRRGTTDRAGATSPPIARSSWTAPSLPGRSLRAAIRRTCCGATRWVSRSFSLALAGVLWMLVVAPARAVLLLAFPVPFFAFISQHRAGKPLPEPGASRSWRCSPLDAGATG